MRLRRLERSISPARSTILRRSSEKYHSDNHKSVEKHHSDKHKSSEEHKSHQNSDIRRINARHTTIFKAEIVPPVPASTPETPAKETSTIVQSTVSTRTSTSMFVDEDGTAFEVVDGSETVPYQPGPTGSQSFQRRRLLSQKLKNGDRKQKTYFLQGPPQCIRGGNKSVEVGGEEAVAEVRRQILVVEVRQMLSKAAELQRTGYHSERATNSRWRWFGL